MIEQWIDEIKKHPKSSSIGMMLIHNGVVRETSKCGKSVKGMRLSYDSQKLNKAIEEIKKREGVVEIKVWINEGYLNVGNDIMKVLVAGRLRTDVFPALQDLVSKIKNEVVHEEEIF